MADERVTREIRPDMTALRGARKDAERADPRPS